MGREERDTVFLEVGLVGIEHSIEPRQELLGAVVRVENDGDSVGGSDSSDESGSGNGTSNRGLLLVGVVLDTLSGPKGSTSLGDLEDNRGLGVTSSLERSVGGGGRGDVDGRDGVLVLTSVLKELPGLLTRENTSLFAKSEISFMVS